MGGGSSFIVTIGLAPVAYLHTADPTELWSQMPTSVHSRLFSDASVVFTLLTFRPPAAPAMRGNQSSDIVRILAAAYPQWNQSYPARFEGVRTHPRAARVWQAQEGAR